MQKTRSGMGYIFAGYSDPMMRTIFKDCLKQENVSILREILPFSTYVNGLFRGLFMRFYKYQFCQILFYIIEKIYHPLEKINTDYEKVYILFTNGASIGISVHYLKNYLKHHKNCIPVMLFMDQMDKYWSEYAKYLVNHISQFRCFTFDPEDARDTGYKHTMNIYSCQDAPTGGISADIYFSFLGKDRLDLVRDITEYLELGKIKCNIIYVGHIGKDENKLGSVKNVEKRMQYPDILKDVLQANCLLEVLRPEQTGVTLRYYEALCYNKKLLTNNKNIINLPFYNSQYMKVFEKPSDIDCQWVRRREKVNYHYENEFSPVHFLEEIAGSETDDSSRNI